MKKKAPLARRIYAALLHLYPADFRRDYPGELTMVFEDMHHAAAAQGLRAYASLWLAILLDLLSSAIRERMRTMLRRADSAPGAPFSPTRSHTNIGLSILVAVAIIFSKAVLFPLEPVVGQPGLAAILVQGLCLLALLLLPAAFLLNRLPRFARAGSEGALVFQPTLLNLIIGAALLLVLLMEVSGFIVEAIA